MHKLLFVTSFIVALAAAAFTVGACTSPERESCEEFREVRATCDAYNVFTFKPVNYDLCNNVDPECTEFYECAVQQPCNDINANRKNVDPVWRLDYRDACPQPEDKECTDEDLRIPVYPEDEEE